MAMRSVNEKERADERPAYMKLVNSLGGHSDSITQLQAHPTNPALVISSSRDKSMIIWSLTRDENGRVIGGKPMRTMTGHGHFVSDMALSADGMYLVSASWDRSLRLWDVETCTSTRNFVSHTKDVLSVAFSEDNRQVVSGARDNTLKLWNTLGQCKITFNEASEGHTHWVSCVRFGKDKNQHMIVSGGWDKVLKVWDLTTCKLRTNHIGHMGYISTVAVSPDGSLCASGGKNSAVNLWDMNESHHLYELNCRGLTSAVAFSPNFYWLCTANDMGIQIWDLEAKTVLDVLEVEVHSNNMNATSPRCTSLQFVSDGNALLAGYDDGMLRVWSVEKWITDEQFGTANE